MNENIDLTKILKNCPKETKFYSSIYGELIYSSMYTDSSNSKIYFIDQNSRSMIDGSPIVVSYYRDGRLYATKGECTIFPSKDQRDWSKFTAPWYKKDKFDPKTLKPFDKVLVFKLDKKQWVCSLFSHLVVIDGVYYAWVTAGWRYNFCIPYTDDTKHLVGTDNDAPEYYRYWEE